MTIAIRGCTENDLPALLDFVVPYSSRSSDADSAVHRSVFADILRLPGRDQEQDCVLLFDNDDDAGRPALRGFCLVFPEPLAGRCALNIHAAPGEGLEAGYRALVRAGLERSREVGAAASQIALWPPYDRAADLGSEGFAMARVYWDMTWEEERIARVELPDNYWVRHFGADDIAELTRVHNAAFAGSWGFSPYTEEQTAHRVKMANTSYRGIRLLFHGEQLAGYCWTLLMSDGRRRQGVIGSIGLAPEFRGRGVSKTILADGMQYLRSAGADYVRLEVDGGNLPAIRLYQSFGFRKTGELHWYERKL